MSGTRFAGRRVLVTGASRGIGAATAQRFAADGADVALVARTLDQHDHLAGSLRETAARIERYGVRAAVITADLASDDRSRIVPSAIDALGGPIDILVNNAAAAMYAPTRDISLKRRRVIFEVNVHAPLDLAQAVLPSMVERGEGWIVNISSGTARPIANSTMTAYGASKVALNRLTDGLAIELVGSGVRVNTVEPRAAVMSEGAVALIGDAVRADQIESMEEMVEAIVALADCPADSTGRHWISLDLIDDMRLTVHSLDGIPLATGSDVSGAHNLFDLTGKVAIVTGSTKGIGRGIATGLAQAGAAVVVSSRKQDLCDQVAHEIAAETGATTLGLACHVGDWDSIPEFVQAVHARFGEIDVLVNNAGITPTRLTVSEITRDVWQKIFSVNVEGPLRMAQCVAPLMRDHGGGSIVNIASMAAYSGGPGVCAYGASKAALVNLTKSMAQEWVSWNIRVNVLSPGPFLSEMVEGAERNAPGFKDLIANGTLMKRVAEPAEIVGPVLYLASDASSFVTGDDISVSGGMQK